MSIAIKTGGKGGSSEWDDSMKYSRELENGKFQYEAKLSSEAVQTITTMQLAGASRYDIVAYLGERTMQNKEHIPSGFFDLAMGTTAPLHFTGDEFEDLDNTPSGDEPVYEPVDEKPLLGEPDRTSPNYLKNLAKPVIEKLEEVKKKADIVIKEVGTYAKVKYDEFTNSEIIKKLKSIWSYYVGRCHTDLHTRYNGFNNNETYAQCMIGYLTQRYETELTVKKAIKVGKFFNTVGKEKKPVLLNLLYFIESYSINAILYNAFGTVIYANDPKEDNGRPPLRGIIYDNHLYFSNDKIPSFSAKLIDYKGLSKFAQDMSPNFNYYAEQNLHTTSLLYSTICIEKTTDPFTLPKLCESHHTYDLKKAFWNSLITSNTNSDKIGVFSIVDLLKPTKITTINQIINEAIYIIAFKPKYYTSTVVLGFELKQLLEMGLTELEYIEYEKIPSSTITEKSYIDKINDQEIKDFFYIANGITGRKFSDRGGSFIINSKADLELLRLTEPEAVIDYGIKNTDKKRVFKSRKNYLNLNNRNLYNHTISKTNLVVLKQIQKLNKVGVEVLKIRVDDLIIENGLQHEHLFDLNLWHSNPTTIEKLISASHIPKISFEHCGLDLNEVRKKALTSKYYDTAKHNLGYHNIQADKIIADTKAEIQKRAEKIHIISAPAGYGKTSIMREKHKVEPFYKALAITNSALANIKLPYINKEINTTEVCTVKTATLFSAMGFGFKVPLSRYRNRKIWVDEFSMIDLNTYTMLYACNAEIHFTGDYKQLGAISGSVDYKSEFFKMFFINSTTLTTSYRCDASINQILVDRHTELLKETESYLEYNTHLAFTNKTCAQVNNAIVAHRKLEYRPQPATETTEEIRGYSIGLRLKARINKKGVFENNAIYEVVKHYNNKITLKNCSSQCLYVVDKEQLDYFSLGFCYTVHSAQGLTIKEIGILHKSHDMSESLFYTAVSRFENSNKVMKYSGEYESNDVDICKKISITSRLLHNKFN